MQLHIQPLKLLPSKQCSHFNNEYWGKVNWWGAICDL